MTGEIRKKISVQCIIDSHMKRVACTAVYQHLSRQSVNQRLFIEPSVDIGERLESRTQSIVFNFNYSLFPFWYLLLLTLYLKKTMYNIPHKTQENIQGVVASDFHKVESRNCL